MEISRITVGSCSVPERSTFGVSQKDGFADTLWQALEEVDNLQKEADAAILDVALGKEENLHRAIIALERANLALGLAVQVRNKVIEAYQEIMRMQV
ncbi:MAG: flagellar hook-basal body complex protein FliE [Candidatus Caldatribacterium sp.]|uniref:flagellar hook-basal body complex protein FliE n=1 Tax=Candidatus Caldatribacterium sp. TaxID=2282143 RepID=UPI002995CBFE|nr:flagellar hook-basal body complex protein FliE [Candidatus Caldatribacterium sp.]MCX7730089.1 flagellar hook-basal body complex protein FliE [Candidatus Caldatribacterium sp.]MDW8080989.1 flagellar hook-basal body complex protein FliE [Candidatus Calescibacterium sp.]